jgi:hypothetical protein
MKLTLTLSECLSKMTSAAWEEFCDDEGWSCYVVNEGGGYIEVSFSEKQAEKYGLLGGDQIK